MDDEQRSAKTDEASDHEPDKEDESCCDVFPFMQLPDDMRARALEYLLSASEACHDPWASAKRVPYSAAASLDTLLFHARDDPLELGSASPAALLPATLPPC